jgi:opacity protein-like surface antigen
MRKSLFFALLFAFVLPFTAPKAQAQFFLSPYVGYNIDAEAFLVGIGSEFAAPFSAGQFELAIRPSVEYLFVDDSGFGASDASINFYQVNGDVITRLNAEGFNPYVGAGLAIVITSADFDCEGNPTCEQFEDAASGSDIGLNVVGGLEFPGALAFGAPFVQGRLTLADGSAISILGGIMIPLGTEN